MQCVRVLSARKGRAELAALAFVALVGCLQAPAAMADKVKVKTEITAAEERSRAERASTSS